MKEPFTNRTDPKENDIAEKLQAISEQTHATPYFVSELEEKLRSRHKPKAAWFLAWRDLTPSLGWVALVLAVSMLLIWSIRTLVPAPHPAANGTPVNQNPAATPTHVPSTTKENATPVPEDTGYDWRGAKLVLGVSLPDSPAQANIYTLRDPQLPTADYVQKLADQFGIQGQLYITQGQIPGTSAFMVTDGKQQLVVYAENNYTYTSDMVENLRNYNGYKNDNAEVIIREFLQTHGIAFNFTFETNDLFGGYLLEQLAPDGIPMNYEYYSQPVMRITLTEDGHILGMNAMLVNYDLAPVGSYAILSAEAALQLLLDDTVIGGKLETAHGSPDPNAIPPQNWYHEYPDNETVTLYGNVSSNHAVAPNQPPLIFIDAVLAVGKTSGMEAVENYTFIQATGQFIIENGVRKFHVDSWDQNIQLASLYGSAHRVGNQVMFTNEDGSSSEYILVDPPADLPLDTPFPESMLSVNGAILDRQFHWTSLQFVADSSQMGGGGGGGGMGFYQLNLSGTPIPFPTPVPTQPEYSPAELAGFLKYTVKPNDTLEFIAATFNVSSEDIARANNMTDSTVNTGWQLVIPGVPGATRLDRARGMVRVQIYKKPNGTQRTHYMFFSEADQSVFELEGNNLEPLQDVANRPIEIWGNISIDKSGTAFLEVEKFESLYPDLEFQILTGTQEIKEIQGMQVVLFTTGGTTYVQLVSTGGYPDGNYYEGAGEVKIEALQVPDETYAGYSAIRVFNNGPATNPVTGDPVELNRTTDTIMIMPDPFGDADHYIAPNMTIEKVELVYFVSNPTYQKNTMDPLQIERYIQPAWHFSGHYANGDEVDILIQALKQEFLSPELAPPFMPG